MKITIVCAGKVKEAWLRSGIEEYRKRMGRYATLVIAEVEDEKTPDKTPAALEQKILETEGERLLKQIRDTDYVIALAVDGTMYDSVEFAGKIQKLGVDGKGSLVFVIGGSLGLSPLVLQRADEKISFSRMTFPHQLMRLIFLEQLYRGFRIMRGEPYHK